MSYLNEVEVSGLLAAVDQTRWEGRRDYTLILLAIKTGLRISEILGLTSGDIILGAGAHLPRLGKGRKGRAVPLNEPVRQALRGWLAERHRHPTNQSSSPAPAGGSVANSAHTRSGTPAR